MQDKIDKDVIERIIDEQARKLEATRPVNGPEGEPMSDEQIKQAALFWRRKELDNAIAKGLLYTPPYKQPKPKAYMETRAELLAHPELGERFFAFLWFWAIEVKPSEAEANNLALIYVGKWMTDKKRGLR